MRVKCISNSGKALPERLRDPASGFAETTRFDLTLGSEYVVYGLTLFLGDCWYYICDDSYSYYPVWNPAVLFSIVENRISRFWRLGYRTKHESSDEALILAFPEWTSDPYFYDKLTNGDPDSVSLFERYKDLIDKESLQKPNEPDLASLHHTP